MIRRTRTPAAIVCLLTAAIFNSGCKRQVEAQKSTYAEPKKCQSCHAATHNSFQHVGMAQAFGEVAALNQVEDFGSRAELVHAASGRHYQVIRRGERIFQRRFELDTSGHEINSFEMEATHAIGSGNHARTYLNRSSIGEFTELPLTWYSQEKRWHLSPGFDQSSPPDFTRIVDDRCLFCHNGYPAPDGKLASGIDCQRCHGPGARHAELAASGKASKQELTNAIVNPARLSTERQLDVCMQCHLETTSAGLPSSVRRFNRAVFSLVPGERLGDYAVQFDNQQQDKFEIVNQAYRLRQSACFLKSGGRLTCTTCHNPHKTTRGAAAGTSVSNRCRSCHGALTGAHPVPVTAECVSCHMPERRTEDAVHVVMTDHRIQRRPPAGDLKRAREDASGQAIGRPIVYYPTDLPDRDRDIYLGVALVLNGTGRREGIELLERHQTDAPPGAIAVLGEAYFAEGLLSKSIEAFRHALEKDPLLAKARYNLAQALHANGNTADAEKEFLEAIRLQPEFPEAEYAFGNFLMLTGQRESAIAHFNTATRLRPTYAQAWSNLGALQNDAEKLQQALRIDPALADAHINLARIFAGQGHLGEAIAHARTAVRLADTNALAHYNLARLLHAANQSTSALEEYRRALQLQPAFAEAHLALGQLLGDEGRIKDAVTEFREVLRIRPDNAEARQNLSMALGMLQGGR